MAKAKKTETPKTAATKKKTSKATSGAPAEQPLVDTNLAAQAAARRVVAGLAPAGAASTTPMPESASFKHLKDSMSKTAPSGLTSMLDKTTGLGHNKSNTPFHGGKQTGRNQTFGADVNRSGVPRRTGGG